MHITIERMDDQPGGYQLTTQLHVAEDREQVFAFFSDARQLETITPSWLHFSVLTPAPIQMRAGALIDYRLRIRGIPLRWRSKIGDWDPPCQFMDEQIRGPYRYWRHFHTFEQCRDGTLIRDVVHYRVPLGFIIHPLLVRRDLINVFQFRHTALQRIFSAGDETGNQERA